MGVFNELLEGGLNNALAKRLAMAGSSAPSPSLAPEIFPTIEMGVAWEELAFNQGWRRWQGFMHQDAVAGEKARFRLANPTGNGVLVMVERILFGASSAATTILGDFGYANGAELTTPVNTAEFRDTRQRPSGTGAMRSSRATAVAELTGTACRILVPAVLDVDIPGGPWLLWGDGEMLFGTSTANLAVTMNFTWSERALTRGELLG